MESHICVYMFVFLELVLQELYIDVSIVFISIYF